MKEDFATSLIRVFEYGMAFGQKKKDEPVRRGKAKKKEIEADIDVMELYLRQQAKADRLKKIVEDINKLNKKEDKKPEGLFDKWTQPQIAIALILISPSLILYAKWMRQLLGGW